MTRDDVGSKVLNKTTDHLILSIGTGIGKTKFSLDKTNQWFEKDCKILIVVPKLILIKSWITEIKKFGYTKLISNITFSTYRSIPKQNTYWDICIFDEAHHLSERCRESVDSWSIKHSLWLSATFKRDIVQYLYSKFKDIETVSLRTNEAINNNILPKPNIILIPLYLDNTDKSILVPKNSKSKNSTCIVDYESRWKVPKTIKNYQIRCTRYQAYILQSEKVEWYKKKAMTGIEAMKNLWLHSAGERLKWLAEQKVYYTKRIIDILGKRRILTFCASIKQSEMFGNCVNSKEGTENLELFNKKKIDRITAVAILDEGANLNDCQIGLFNMINSSELLTIQRIGRCLRHNNPIVIFPFFKNTREEEIVDKIVEDYDNNLITRLNSINEFNSMLL